MGWLARYTAYPHQPLCQAMHPVPINRYFIIIIIIIIITFIIIYRYYFKYLNELIAF